MNAADHYLTRYLEAKDLDQYNALLRYTFQVTEEELTATGWKDDEIKQSKFRCWNVPMYWAALMETRWCPSLPSIR